MSFESNFAFYNSFLIITYMASHNLVYSYSCALSSASVILTTLYNLYIIMRIRYGSVLITKFTLKPYYLTFAYLALSSVVSLMRYYLYITRDPAKITLDYWNNVDGDTMIGVTRFMLSITHVLFVYFIAMRINSCAIVY